MLDGASQARSQQRSESELQSVRECSSFLAAADRPGHSDRAGSNVSRHATRLISAISNHVWVSQHVLGGHADFAHDGPSMVCRRPGCPGSQAAQAWCCTMFLVNTLWSAGLPRPPMPPGGAIVIPDYPSMWGCQTSCGVCLLSRCLNLRPNAARRKQSLLSQRVAVCRRYSSILSQIKQASKETLINLQLISHFR